MVADKTTILPSREEMLKRLLKVVDDSNLQREFYPTILEEAAGQQMNSVEVVVLVQVAVCDYVLSMRSPTGRELNMLIPDFLDAVIPDKAVAEEAKEFYRKIIAGSGSRTVH